MGEHEWNRSTPGRTRRPFSHPPDVPSPVRSALTPEEQEEQRLTVLPPIVWTAGIAGVVAVLLLSA
jgi:hypothetical protein